MALDGSTILEKDVLKGVGPTTIKKLEKAGLITLLQIAATPAMEIVALTGMGADTADKVLTLAQKAISVYKTAAEKHEERQTKVRRIRSGAEAFDALLGGGFETGIITEIIGEFASGKTQICFNQSVMVQLPEEQGGLGRGAIYLDTERTFVADRIREIAESRGLDVESIMNNIHIADVYNSDHLKVLIQTLPQLLQTGDFGLIVVDSMAGHFRSEFIGRENLAPRQQKLAGILGNLLRLAESFDIAVIVTNQVIANPTAYGKPYKAALGNIMAHAGTVRLKLRKGRQNVRIVEMHDSSYLAPGEAPIRITEKGIEGPEGKNDE